jgi:uncharacterized damage-inducible protein DinB
VPVLRDSLASALIFAMTEVHRIVATMRHTFEKNAWHGPSVKETLQGITAETARNRYNNTHSIIELVAHMTAWRTFTFRKLQGDTSYQVNDALNFPVVNDWALVVNELEDSQNKLLESVAELPEEKLSDTVPHEGNIYTFYTLLHGIIHHDLYHTGQIAILKKSFS